METHTTEENEAEERKGFWIITGIVGFLIALSIGIVSLFHDFIPQEWVERNMFWFLAIGIFIAVFAWVRGCDVSLPIALVTALLVSVFTIGALHTFHSAVERHEAFLDQKYECRMEGGQLEDFGKRGWICIYPKN